MRTTVDLSDEAYQVAKSVARERRESMGKVMSDLILKGANGPGDQVGEIVMEKGVPVISIGRMVTSDEVKAFLEDDE